jgi:hypothetical protein
VQVARAEADRAMWRPAIHPTASRAQLVSVSSGLNQDFINHGMSRADNKDSFWYYHNSRMTRALRCAVCMWNALHDS